MGHVDGADGSDEKIEEEQPFSEDSFNPEDFEEVEQASKDIR